MTEEECVSYALKCVALGVGLPKNIQNELKELGILELIEGDRDGKDSYSPEIYIS